MIRGVGRGFEAFVFDGGQKFGAVRDVVDGKMLLYVENAGEFLVSGDAIVAVHAQKVILDCKKLDRRLRDAIGHAHDDEEPGA